MAYSITVDESAILDGANADAADVNTPLSNIKTAVEDLGNGVSGPEQFRLVEIATPASPASGSDKLYINSTDHKLHRKNSSGTDISVEAGLKYPGVPKGRLTLTTATPVTASDVTAATTLYYTPYLGSELSVYNSDTLVWDTVVLTELSLSLSGFAANIPRDIFVYYGGGGVLSLTSVAWNSISARASALALQDGAYVQFAVPSARYIGTICTTGTIGQTEDSKLNRLIWNYYNRVQRNFVVTEGTDSWTYTSATWRSWNNSASNRVAFVVGIAEDAVSLMFSGTISTTSAGAGIAIGYDSTSVTSGAIGRQQNASVIAVPALYNVIPAAGYHFLQLLESGVATATFYGDNGGTVIQSGAFGTMAA